MGGCILGLILFLTVALYFTLGLRAKAEPYTPPPERHVEGRSPDPAETYRRVMGAVDAGRRLAPQIVIMTLAAEIERRNQEGMEEAE